MCGAGVKDILNSDSNVQLSGGHNARVVIVFLAVCNTSHINEQPVALVHFFMKDERLGVLHWLSLLVALNEKKKKNSLTFCYTALFSIPKIGSFLESEVQT